ncbi:MAG: hypothetical protein ABI382_05815 [Nakamurella sp.]
MFAKKLLIVGAAAATLSIGLVAPAFAATSTAGTSYQATLSPVALNTPAGAASGQVMITIKGDQATVTETVKGLATKLPTDAATLDAIGVPQAFAGAAFPHVQHIHINGNDTCPVASSDTNKDGVISTVEGQPAYGKIGTTLSTKGATDGSTALDVTLAPSGGSYTYNRTFTINAATLSAIQANKAVIVVHGLNPANAPKASLSTPNSLNLTLPGASKKVAVIATAPALCGALKASQMSAMPVGAANTGGGSMAASGVNQTELGLGALALLAAGGMLFIGFRRRSTQN